MPASRTGLEHDDLLEGLTMLGLAGLIDPPREEAVEAVRECAGAGIQVKMITGDHLETARAIGRRMGISDGALAMDGRQIDALDDDALREKVQECNIYARTSPEHKLRLVRALQAGGKICAMTGDGVNDAPALKMADIGIAMGIKGTEVTKEAAEIVLADDNFQTIAAAVEEGRKVYDNLRKTLLFILPTNLAEGLLIVVSILFGSIAVLTPVQVLWVNMVTTVTISFALAFEPLEPCAMLRKPRPPTEPLLGAYFLFRIIYVGLVMGGACLVLSFYTLDLSAISEAAYQTIMVQTLVVCECLYLFNVRHITEPAFNRQFFQNRVTFLVLGILVLLQAFATYVPFMNRALGTAPLTAEQWIPPFLVALILFCAVEIEKAVTRALLRRKAGDSGVPCAAQL